MAIQSFTDPAKNVGKAGIKGTIKGGPQGGLTAAGYAAGAYTGGQQISGAMKTFDSDKKLSGTEQVALATMTGGASFLVNPAKKLFGGKGIQKEGKRRESSLGSLADMGIDTELTFGDRGFRNSSAAIGGQDKPLRDYEVDYTNDLDYVAGMAGINLSRLTHGKSDKATDQAGNYLGNKFLSGVGFGKDLTQENFNKTMEGARADYSKAGIQNKDDYLTLANKAFADGRMDDSQYAIPDSFRINTKVPLKAP